MSVFQPADTILEPGFTDPKYTDQMKIWTDRVNRDLEYRHMNAAFGKRMLECALPLLSEHLAKSPVPGAGL
jgi:hypothetical protein